MEWKGEQESYRETKCLLKNSRTNEEKEVHEVKYMVAKKLGKQSCHYSKESRFRKVTSKTW